MLREMLVIALTIASIISGEAGAMDNVSKAAVGHVIVNRWEAGDELGAGFYGWDTPTNEDIAIAMYVLREPDFTDGMKYVLSRNDIHNLGFPEGDLVYEKVNDEGEVILELHFFREWPAGR